MSQYKSEFTGLNAEQKIKSRNKHFSFFTKNYNKSLYQKVMFIHPMYHKNGT